MTRTKHTQAPTTPVPALPPMCVISFGYQHYAVPVVEAAQVFQLLQGAVALESNYGSTLDYKIANKPADFTMKHIPQKLWAEMVAMRTAEDELGA